MIIHLIHWASSIFWFPKFKSILKEQISITTENIQKTLKVTF